MESNAIKQLLEAVSNKKTSISDAIKKLNDISFSDIDFARIDHGRALRTGHPEVIFCQGKSINNIVSIVKNQIAHEETVLGTRASKEVLSKIKKEFPNAKINKTGRCFWIKSKTWKTKEKTKGTIVIASAGTADAFVVEETACTLEVYGHSYKILNDVGVSGIHRLFAQKELLQSASVIIVVAGMEGALPSVITGFVPCPVIGVPTSIGYGSHFNGMVPMLAMLNSCASGLTVVNIDNGFGAGIAAIRMNSL